MAILNVNEKKLPSAENLHLLSSLILSLSSKQGTMENKLINNWVASTAYIKDESFVIYDELLYVCKISNADATFDKNKWTCLSPIIKELSKADIEALINLTPEQITNLQSLIDDTSISTTHTNSSSHIYMAIQDAIAECKNDTLKQIAKKVSGSYKIANTTADIVSADYIYLLNNGTNYDLYVLVNGTATKVGDTNIELSEYVKTTDLTDYMKTSDADGKFATIDSVDGKVDKTDIVTALDDTVTDDQVTSALLTKTELDKLSDSLVDKVDKSYVDNNLSNMSKLKITTYSEGSFESIIGGLPLGYHSIRLTSAVSGTPVSKTLDCFIIKSSGNEATAIACASDGSMYRKRIYGQANIDWQELSTIESVAPKQLTGRAVHTDANGYTTISLGETLTRDRIVFVFPTSDTTACCNARVVKAGSSSVGVTIYTAGKVYANADVWVGIIIL